MEESGEVLAVGEDLAGRKLPSKAWMALRRLGWTIAPPAGVKVNDRIVRMAQEQAGRALRAARWRADLVAGILAAWPVDPAGRTPQEWQAVREAVPGGQFLPSTIITSRTRQSTAFERRHGRLPADVFELEPVPRTAPMLLLAACDGQQSITAHATGHRPHQRHAGDLLGRDDDQHPTRRPPATRGSVGRGIPPTRSRHPGQVGRPPTRCQV